MLPQINRGSSNFTTQELEGVKTLFDALITPLLRPIYNGAIGNSSFKEPLGE